MQILNPAFLGLSLLAVVPVLLYFFRRRSKTVEVSTLVFFKSLAREHQESAWLRHVKKWLSLLLTLLVLFGAVLALAKVAFSPKPGEIRSVVILLDRSASMSATDASGRSRLDVAKQELRTRLDALPENIEVALVVYDVRPEVIQPLSVVRRELIRHLSEVEPRPVEDRPEPAVTSAAMIASLNQPSSIWHVTDSGGSHELPGDVQAERIDVGFPAGTNVGITAFEIRKVPLVSNEYEAFIEVASSPSCPAPVECTLETLIAGAWADTPRTINLEPGATSALVMPIRGAASGQVLELRLSGLEADCLAIDDSVIARLPESQPTIVVHVSESADSYDPFTRLALEAIAEDGALSVFVTTADKVPIDGVDVYLFDHCLPADWPAATPAIVLSPPGTLGPVRAVALSNGVPRGEVRVTNPEHPVLFRVSNSRVALTQTAVIDTSGSLEPLWFAGDEPVLAAGDVGGERLVVLGFSPMQSEKLPLMASYPLLLENAILWCQDAADEGAGLGSLRAGSLIEAEGGRLSWLGLEGGELTPSEQQVSGSLLELNRLGLWQTADGRQGSSLLLSPHETNLQARSADEMVVASGNGAPRNGMLRGDITWLFLWLILAVLILESYLFHRHSVY